MIAGNRFTTCFVLITAALCLNCGFLALPALCQGKDVLLLKPTIEKTAITEPFTLKGAVTFAETNYPSILKAQAQLRASHTNVTVQKLNEYLPDGLLQWQEIMASRNKMTQVLYGSPVFPGNPGPGFNSVNMEPRFYSGGGFNFDWAPVDFGLHKARIELSRLQYGQTRAAYGATKLDVQISAANAFLDLVEASQQIKATEENVASFEQFNNIVSAQVNADLKPGADAALASAQLANARNQMLRAELNRDIARATLANAIGVAGVEVEVIEKGIVTAVEQASIQHTTPVFTAVPILQQAHASILSALAQKKVLNKEWAPVFHFLTGFQLRGSAQDVHGKVTWMDAAGLIPVVPNYQVAMIINWNFLDPIRLHYEKQVQDQRIIAQQQEYNQVLQNLKTQDQQSRARLKAATAIALNMPVQVHAAEQAANQAQARYKVGLSSVAQVAESNQILAQSRMQEAIAKVAVWRAMLSIAAAHGDLRPFLAEADRVQRGM